MMDLKFYQRAADICGMGTLGRERALSTIRETFDLEEWVITVYTALDNALAEAGVAARGGKWVPRSGPAPDVDDREVLWLAVLQELLGFESDHAFYQWLESNAVLRQLFPRRLTRSNGADRWALLTPLVQRLSQAFCALDGEEAPLDDDAET